MKRLILGILYCILWYISILVGFFLFICPLLPLVYFHPRLYRKWSEIIFGMWEPFPVALMEIFFGMRAVLTGDQIDPFERSLLIMNHRTRLDWNFLWVGLFHCCHPYSHALKYVLKAAVMHFPGPGWVMQTCSFLFVYRNWAKDQQLLERLIQYLDTSDEPYQILIFPEGTDLTPSNMQKSHKYADEHSLERYYNVLHPKTTGFAFIAHKMKLSGKINAVYDITIGYPGEAPQNESELLKGNIPEEVHFHVKRYNACELPVEESGLKTWLNDVWRHKEITLSKFERNRSFTHPEENSSDENRRYLNPERLGRNSSNKIESNTFHNNNVLKKLGTNPVSHLNNELKQGSISRFERSHFSGSNDEGYDATSENSFESAVADENVATTSRLKPSRLNSKCATPNLINRNRPSHLLYLTFWFWLVLIYFTTHQFFVNFYVQVWVLVHTLFFSLISIMSNGFHHIIASIYFYRCNVKENIIAKND